MSWKLSILFVLSIPILVFLTCSVFESIKNLKSNIKLGKHYKEQRFYKKDLDLCPECKYPYLWCRIVKEGFWRPFICDMYHVDTFVCHNCGYRVVVILKWDKKNWEYV